jgi:hypothetical protein
MNIAFIVQRGLQIVEAWPDIKYNKKSYKKLLIISIKNACWLEIIYAMPIPRKLQP